ncbi:MAG: hypothetical protein AAFZ52_01885 [Bacteroidota bacterium]
MNDRKRTALIALCLLGVCLLNFPFIGLPEKLVPQGGMPLLPWYLLAVWLGITGGVFFLTRRRS